MASILAGALALIALETLVTKGAGRAGALAGFGAELVRRVVDPTVPLVPDLRSSSSSVANANGAGDRAAAPGNPRFVWSKKLHRWVLVPGAV